ncbi:MAG: glycosyltransferase [Bacteroidales bacterium]|nr:glycosyltransferase [Bacteroidales bacterium]
MSNLHIAIPAMDELEYLPQTLQSIEDSVFSGKSSSERPYTVYVCVNQPDDWWGDTVEHRRICESNAALLRVLEGGSPVHPLVVIDRSSKGSGWTGKNFGVGWARKVLFDHILSVAAPDDLIVSMDADTQFGPNYLQSLLDSFAAHPEWVALSAPYYHRLTGDDGTDRAILHYEIYMRNYAINMLRIGSPYSFTAIGSAIVVRAESLRKISGITPVKSGEDFYLVQKLTKMGPVSSWNPESVYPAARFSDRVFFGTGPAMSKAASGDLSSYPIYHHSLFAKVAATYSLTDELYHHDLHSEFLDFLQQQFKQSDLWSTIRNNVKDSNQFRRAFHEKADGLRILQFLKQKQKAEPIPDMQSLRENLMLFLTDARCAEEAGNGLEKALPEIQAANDITSLSTATLAILRDTLRNMEMALRHALA